MRARFRQLGCRVAEVPLNAETARAAREAGEAVVFGAPNVLRGGSHTGAPSAAEMVRLGLGTILASDYVFPALAQAPFLLAEAGECGFAEGWALVSSRPATALGLEDRGTLANGKRADVTVVREVPAGLAIVATIANGRLVHLSEGQRIAAP